MHAAITIADVVETLRQIQFAWPASLPLVALGLADASRRRNQQAQPALSPAAKLQLLTAIVLGAVAIICIATVVRLYVSHTLIVSIILVVGIMVTLAGLLSLVVEGGKLILSYGHFHLKVFSTGLALCVIGITTLFLADRIMTPAAQHTTSINQQRHAQSECVCARVHEVTTA
jgi:zinc transporter ZupT